MAIPQIVSTRNGSGSITGYRDDLAQGDLIGLSLTNTVGITSVRWELIGRPEGSTAGGAGPEPILLPAGLTSAFTSDTDAGDFRLDGTYTVSATLNPGSPGEKQITAVLCRVSGLMIPGPSSTLRTLRKLGGFETLEDTSIATIVQGWATELNRWLELVRETVTGGGPSDFTTIAGAYSHGGSSSDQTMVMHDAKGGGLILDATQGDFTAANALRVNTPAGGPLTIARATGALGIGTASPAQPIHIANTAPAIRLDRTGGAALDIANVGDELQFLNGATVLGKFEPTGGLRADLGVGIGTAPATNPVLSLGDGAGVAISAAGTARFRYNSGSGHAEWSENAGPWQPFSAPFSAYTTIDAAGTPVTQRTTLNFAATFGVADNAGATRTDVDLAINSVTNAMLRQSAAFSLVGNPTGATANVQDVGIGVGLGFSGTTLINTSVASWPFTGQRWYAADTVNGNDANVGFSDSSEADAGTKAVKTLARLFELIPKNGAGRNVKIVIANGGVNTAGSYSDPLPVNGLYGYNIIGIIGTGTNTTAGAVAFDGSANTDLYAGAITVPGLNAPGYNPTGTPSTTSWSLQQVGGGAAALPAEPAAPLGWRVRFDINTSTASLRGLCKAISQVNSSSQLTIDATSPLPTPPTGADVFYIEKAGVLVSVNTNINVSAATAFLSIGGIDMTGGVFLNEGIAQFTFCGTTTLNLQAPAEVQVKPQWQGNFPSATRRLGGGLVVSGNTNNSSFGSARWVGCSNLTHLGSVEILDPLGAFNIGNATTWANGIVIQGSSMAVQSPDGIDGLGALTATAIPRIIGPGAYIGGTGDLVLRGTNMSLRFIALTGAGGNPAIKVIGKNNVVFALTVSGSSGNSDVGMDLTAAYESSFTILSLPTVTGTAGDVRLADGTIISWTAAAAGIQDIAGNRIVGVGQPFPIQRTPVGTYLTDLSIGGVVSAAAGTGLLSAGPVTPTATTGIVATWALTTTRTFLYDPVHGNDANLGYSDVAGPYNPATQAKLTANGLQTVFPRVFNGRSFRLLLASGSYANPDLDQLLAGATGIGSGSVVRGTSTNITAAATAFGDDINDRTFVGATTATGCNAGGYNPTAGVTTQSIPCQLNGGGAPALPAEPAAPLMWRVRFDSATTTAALRNICRAVVQVSGGTTVQLENVLPATPTTGDVFYLEQAGAVFPSIRIGGTSSEATSAAGITTGLQIVGVRSSGTSVYGEGYFSFAMSGATGSTTFRTGNVQTKSTYFEPLAATTLTIGGGFKGDADVVLQSNYQVNLNTFACSGELSLLIYGQLNIQYGVVGGGILLNTSSALTTVGTTILRVLGPEDEAGIEMQSSWLVNTDVTNGITLTGMGSFPAIKADGVSNQIQLSSNVTGSTGNNDVGLDLTAAQNTMIYLSSQPTVTGTVGDIRMADGSIITWAQAMGGISDLRGNRFISGTTAFPIQRLPAGTYLTDLSVGGPVQATPGTGLLKVGAYRIDLPLATAWFIDPVAGSDSNAGTTSNAALASLQELKRRWWNAEITANTTVTILGNVAGSDVGAWNFTVDQGLTVTFIGSLGATTGAGGRGIDNTLYSGSVTAFTAASDLPSATDSQLGDSAIPTSFTASGLMAHGVIFKRTNSTALYWYAAKDLGSKTIRVSPPALNAPVNLSSALNVTDTYSAYQMWTMPAQDFGPAMINVRYDSLWDNIGLLTSIGTGFDRRRCWINVSSVRPFTTRDGLINNCYDATGGSGNMTFTPTTMSFFGVEGGMFLGTGASHITFGSGVVEFGWGAIQQGCQISLDDCVLRLPGPSIGQYDMTVPAVALVGKAVLDVSAFGGGTGFVGKNNTSKLVSTSLGDARVYYGGGSAAPPWFAGATSDGAPIQIQGTSYAVAALPAVPNVTLPSGTVFPSTVFETGANTRLTFGAVADGTLLYRSGTAILGATVGSGLTLTSGTLSVSFSAYQTVETNGTPLTQRTILNFSPRFAVADNSGATRTDVELASSGVSPGSYSSSNITVDAFGRVTAASNGGGGAVFYQTIENAGISVPQRGAWNASTGLTAVDNGGAGRTDVSANLSTGIAGGQSVFGGTAGGEGLHLVSTTSGTKGQVYLGAATADFYDEPTGGFSLGSTLSAGGMVKALGTSGKLALAISGTDFQPAGSYITALTGDVVATGPGSVTATIQPHVVSYGKMQQESATTLLGNPTGGLANVQEISVGPGLGFVNFGGGPVLTNTSPLTDLSALAPIILSGNVISFPGAISYGGPGSIDLSSLSTGLVLLTAGAGPGGGAGLTTITAYQIIEASGSALPQRSILNFTADFSAVDNSGSSSTDVSLANVGPGTGTYGGTGISSISLDDRGRVVSLTTATYLTAMTCFGTFQIGGFLSTLGSGNHWLGVGENDISNSAIEYPIGGILAQGSTQVNFNINIGTMTGFSGGFTLSITMDGTVIFTSGTISTTGLYTTGLVSVAGGHTLGLRLQYGGGGAPTLDIRATGVFT